VIRATIRKSIGLFALVALSACATQDPPERQAEDALQCAPTETKTCDRFAGENHNCTCERGGNLREMLDAYHVD
jgi:hypothetical protein